MDVAAVVTALRVVAVAEALSWVGLLAGMYVKHVLRWSPGTTVLALAAAVPPLATVWFERWATRTGRLALRSVRAAR